VPALAGRTVVVVGGGVVAELVGEVAWLVMGDAAAERAFNQAIEA
jgi:hypothetical protein